jgi:hypothetical protein
VIKKIALSAAAAISLPVIAVLALAATKPDELVVERSKTIKAPAEKIFPLINNLHNWTKWSPYEEKDPTMKRTFNGPESGKGALYEWSGNDQIGVGTMEITDSAAPSKVTIKLHFIKPFAGDNKVIFSLVPDSDGTKVTWMMHGPSPFMCKVMQVFINMDDMCGKDFAHGLDKLKKEAES